MAATLLIKRLTGTGGSEVETDITSANTVASTSDSPTPGSANPIPIPPSGNKYSFWVSTRLNCTVTPVGTVDNLKFYSDGVSFGTGITVKAAKASTGANAGYRIAAGTVGDTGTLLNQTNHTGLDAAPVDVTTLVVGSPLTLTGSITNPTTGLFGDLMVVQFDVTSTTVPGATAQNTMSWQYDET